MTFIGVEELIRFLNGRELTSLLPSSLLYLYPIKTAFVGLTLLYLRKHYNEIRFADLANLRNLFFSITIGIVVFILWINMDWSLGLQRHPAGFDPTIVSDSLTRSVLIIFRIFGAAVVVPVMEELFWRSWLLRYLINNDFAKAQIGSFTWPSFLICAVLFGTEHNYILAGIMAGAAYSLLLYRTKSIIHCIMAHAVTNFSLGIYVRYMC
jgi:CAAX prenyl protease-like protein